MPKSLDSPGKPWTVGKYAIFTQPPAVYVCPSLLGVSDVQVAVVHLCTTEVRTLVACKHLETFGGFMDPSVKRVPVDSEVL